MDYMTILLLLDGLYPNGPVMERCRSYHWDFMIVLEDGSLPTVWEEYHSLRHEQKKTKTLSPLGRAKRQHVVVNGNRPVSDGQASLLSAGEPPFPSVVSEKA